MLKSTPAKNIRLPNAPLVEVVFELRWALVGESSLPLPLHSDPGLLPALNVFTTEVSKLGFHVSKDMSRPQETGAYGIARRYYKAPEQAFPLLQLGPGIYASNQSSGYDWQSFKKQTIQGIRALLNSYPILAGYPLKPMHFELRYIDVFDKSLLGTTDLFKFLNVGTNLSVKLPSIVDSRLFGSGLSGRLLLRLPVRGRQNTVFSFDVGSGTRNKDDVVRLETKVVTTGETVPKIHGPAQFTKAASQWLEAAHDVTSPFFREFVADSVMAKFKAET